MRYAFSLRSYFHALIVALGVIVMISTLLAIFASYSGVPYWDEWEQLTTAEIFRGLFSQQNEHRFAIPRLFFILDKYFFAGSDILNLVLVSVFQFFTALLLIHLGWKNGTRANHPYWIIGFVLALLFSCHLYENLFWGLQLQVVFANLFAIAAFAVFAFGKDHLMTTVAASILGVAATYSQASGPIVFPVLIVMTIVMRRSWINAAFLAAVLVLLLLVYLHGYHSPPHHANPLQSILRLPEVAIYMLTYLGGPISDGIKYAFGLGWLGDAPGISHSPDLDALAVIAGICGWLLTLAYGYHILFRRQIFASAHYTFWAIMLYVIGISCITALGRINFTTAHAVDSRYGTSVLTFWVAALLLAWGAGALVWKRFGQSIPIVAAFLTVIFAVMQFSAFAKAWHWRDPQLDGKNALLARVNDPEALIKLYPRPEFVAARNHLLREGKLTPFYEAWANWLNTAFNQHVRVAGADRCIGRFEKAKRVQPLNDDSNTDSWRVTGWAWDVQRKRVIEKIVMVDDLGDVIGYALTRKYRPDILAAGLGVTDPLSGWAGHAANRKVGKIFAYALLDDEKSACLLEGSHSISIP